MADYIYLLQNRLTPAQWRAVEAVREAARAHGMPVFLVGGAIRDLTSGSPVRDLDFAVQGDLERLITDLEQGGTRVTGRNLALSSAYLTFRGGVRAEIGPTLTVTYPKPGQAVAQSAAILDDLRRRDFTANAMAVSLNEGSYGLLLDPLNGTADLENRELRLVSPYGFIENPALLLRAARLSQRLGWSLEERTATRYQTSKEEGHLEAIAHADRGYELEEIFHEEDPVAIMEHMAEEGWWQQLFPALRSEDTDRGGIDGVRDLIGQLESQGLYPDPSAIYFPLLTGKLNDKDRASLKAMFVRPGFVEQIETVEARAKELGSQLTSKATTLPSEAWKLLKQAEPELVLWLAFHTRSGAVQSKIKAFLKEWPQMRQKLPYAMMQEMRITPELPEYEKLLDDLFFALIDGKLDTPEATRAFLEPYSPPAPPQVTVRRRPAKAAKGRGKRAAAVEVQAEVPEDADENEADDHDAANEDDDETDRDSGSDDDPEELGAGDDIEADEAPEEETAAPVPAPVVSADPPESGVTVIETKTKAPKKEAKDSAQNEPAAPPVVAPPKKLADTKMPVAAKKAAPPPAPPPPKKAAKEVHPAKKAAPHKAATVKVAAKAAPVTKVAAKKQSVKAPVKAVAKIAVKKVVAKKAAPVSHPVKAQAPIKGRAVPPAKKGVPAKAAKKAAVKGRKR